MSDQRRQEVTIAITARRGAISIREVDIRNIEGRIRRLKAQRRVLNDELSFTISTLANDVTRSPQQLNQDNFRGRNREILVERLEDMQSAITNQARAHASNLGRVDAVISRMETNVTTLTSSNTTDQNTINSLLNEWARRNGMSFPNFPAGGS